MNAVNQGGKREREREGWAVMYWRLGAARRI